MIMQWLIIMSEKTEDISLLFKRLQQIERVSTPDFEHLVSSGKTGNPIKVYALAGVLMLTVVLGSVFYRSLVITPTVVSTTKISSWSAPTTSLRKFPGVNVLQANPPLNYVNAIIRYKKFKSPTQSLRYFNSPVIKPLTHARKNRTAT